MSLSMFLMLGVACLTVNASPFNVAPVAPIDQGTLDTVFGTPQKPPSIQTVVPLTPENNTFIDIDANPEDYYKAPVKNYDSFDWSITRLVSTHTYDNFVLSPLGLKLALAILTEAATSRTRDELVAVLDFDLDKEVVRSKFSEIVKSLQLPPIQHGGPEPTFLDRQTQRLRQIMTTARDGIKSTYNWVKERIGYGSADPSDNVEANSSQYILNLGSRVYLDEGVYPQQQFAAIAEKNYQTELKNVSFSRANEAAAEINDWIVKLTNGKIKELVKPDDLQNQVMMIINALYFKGTWVHQFDVNETRKDFFYVKPTDKRETLFMTIQNKFHYVESSYLDAKILRMPFLGRKFSMYIVVPNSLSGIDHVMENLGTLRGEMFHLDARTVNLRLPKFDFDATAHLEGVLKEMGVKEAFTDAASFPGIARGEQVKRKLQVSRVLQKAGIEVNEIGSTAYAASEITLVNKFGDFEVVKTVNANRPFLFFIEDEKTRQLLFTGRLVDPTKRFTSFDTAGDS